MSIGNLKTEGNKGNNFPFQLKVLQGLQALIDSTSANIDCCTDLNKLLQSRERTVTVINATGPDTTPGGVFSVSIANVGTASGTVGGATIPAGTTLNFDAGVLNNTLTAISYDATGTTFIVTYITS
jgi:hypothetical protein